MKLDRELIGFVNVFESMTGARVKDVFFGKDEELVFVVAEGDMGKAIGKMGVNIRRLSGMLKKRIKVIEYSSNLIEFLKSAIDPIKADGFEDVGDAIKILIKDTSLKARLIGRNRRNINEISNLVERYFKKKVVAG